jgi:hypothetical protein
MVVLAPPVITSITLMPSTVTVDVPITANVVWTGFPQTGVRYQWRLAATAIAGATAASYTPSAESAVLNCLVTIDNGRGTATGASDYATIPDIPEPEPGAGPLAFSSGFDEGFE